jgi:hypothetical protein
MTKLQQIKFLMVGNMVIIGEINFITRQRNLTAKKKPSKFVILDGFRKGFTIKNIYNFFDS